MPLFKYCHLFFISKNCVVFITFVTSILFYYILLLLFKSYCVECLDINLFYLQLKTKVNIIKVVYQNLHNYQLHSQTVITECCHLKKVATSQCLQQSVSQCLHQSVSQCLQQSVSYYFQQSLMSQCLQKSMFPTISFTTSSTVKMSPTINIFIRFQEL